MNEPVRASAVWREALAIIVRHPVATVVPALFLAPLSEAPHLIPDDRSYLELTASETWGQWLGGSVATIAILPVASFATALVYGHLRRAEDRDRS